MTTDQRGAIAECAIILEATRLGIPVLQPVAVSRRRYDFVFDLGGRFIRVQCKSAARHRDVVVVRCRSGRRTREGVVMRRYTADEIDAFAAYCLDLDRCYFLPIECFEGLGSIHLRLRPARNNQALRIHRAEDFEFGARLRALGAIAQLGERDAGSVEVAGSSPAGST
jgi:hypothetical protein